MESRAARTVARLCFGPLSISALQPFHEGWARHQAMVIEALRGLHAPSSSPCGPPPISGRSGSWQAHSRRFTPVLVPRCARRRQPGDPGTLPHGPHDRSGSVSSYDAGWEDDEDHPRRSGGARGRAHAHVDDHRRLPSTLDRRGPGWLARSTSLGSAAGANAPPRLGRVARDGARHPPLAGEVSPVPVREQRTRRPRIPD